MTSLIEEMEVPMTIILTNLSDESMLMLSMKFDSGKEQPVIFLGSQGRRKINGGEQIKYELTVVVNNIDGQCPTLSLEYQLSQHSKQELSLLLPIGKLKIC
jgi:hypothetical protein